MKPSPEASRETLIRRLSLDLTGLPPTVEQVDAFVNDSKPRAYERLVDRLLESPAYGQRMAWDWLDAARYADTNGYQGDNERTMWPWRDWVVDAFNRNLPYDQFTVWQLAGDLLPDATFEQKLATAFCRNHMINGEGGRIAEENRIEYVMDMTETMGTVWLGLTLNCCRCHDHKYDPITNAEYYKLFAFFNQTPIQGGGGNPQTPPNLVAPSEIQSARLADLQTQIASLDRETQSLKDSLGSLQPEWEARQLESWSRSPSWQALHAATLEAAGSQLRQLEDDSILATGSPPDNDTYTITAPASADKITAIRLEALQHESLTSNSLSHASSGNFVLTEIEVTLIDSDPTSEQETKLTISGAEATFEQGGHPVKDAFDGKRQSGWAVYEGRVVDREHTAIFHFAEPVPIAPNQQIKVVLRHDSKHARHNLGRFRLSLTSADQPTLADTNEQLLTALQTPLDQRSDTQREQLTKTYLESSPAYQTLGQRRSDLIKQRDEVQSDFPKVMVMADMPEARQTFMLSRGQYNKPTDEVHAEMPAFLPEFSRQEGAASEPLNRLTLARWLVDSSNPLTPRVTVNRFWQQVFGVGLVKTTEDFGAQGEIPVQMDLLNWLAWRFQQDNWDVKNLMRLVVNSHTYRQSSRVTNAEDYQRDPENRFLARGARYRMPAWMLRDQALFVSGLLSAQSGGPAVNSYQPAGVWEEASFGKKKYQQDSGEKLYRRSLYVFWRRIIAPTMFFDNASRQTCTVKFSRTNTPLHALQTLNDVTFVEAARTLAQQVLLDTPVAGGSDQASIDDSVCINEIMRRVLARPASDRERQVLVRGLQRSRAEFANDPSAAATLLAVGESAPMESLDAIEHAAWTSLCLAVLNLDESLNRE